MIPGVHGRTRQACLTLGSLENVFHPIQDHRSLALHDKFRRLLVCCLAGLHRERALRCGAIAGPHMQVEPSDGHRLASGPVCLSRASWPWEHAVSAL